ncbi:hypothetical protein HNY73_021462 [Argiope bruennichi]|uniref:TIL domain-containing protein n=1 Tax=Argiope bruennichi TaxID=94029 RepID=A0A8T0E1A9_ARGBR|nr:hypothetical protein HNY73_021462 [Argiope bruennichi]
MVLVVSLVIGDDYSINADFFDKAGLSRACGGNKTFTRYSACEKRCDRMNPPKNCPDVEYVGCGCKKGYVPIDNTFNKCVLPADCP